MRRRALVQGAALLLGGCGWRPLYMPAGSRGDVASAELAAVWVPVMLERAGMLMRQALQTRLEGSGSGVPKRYELNTGPAITVDSLAIQSDSSSTRYRVTARGDWTLRTFDLERKVLAQGTSLAVDGANILNQQYLALDLQLSATYQSLIESLSDQIVTQVAVFLRRRAAAAPA